MSVSNLISELDFQSISGNDLATLSVSELITLKEGLVSRIQKQKDVRENLLSRFSLFAHTSSSSSTDALPVVEYGNETRRRWEQLLERVKKHIEILTEYKQSYDYT